LHPTKEALRKTEQGVNGKKKAKNGQGKRPKKQVISSKNEIDSNADNSFNIRGLLTPDILDCIEVAE